MGEGERERERERDREIEREREAERERDRERERERQRERERGLTLDKENFVKELTAFWQYAGWFLYQCTCVNQEVHALSHN